MKDEMSGTCNMHAYKILVWRLLGMLLLGGLWQK